ncbi:MAG: sugar transferase, partial [Duncaniella sp.]|nr:sugar transferase [Duncaniella sp.]
LWNVLRGDMSFVGPRPDVPGYADKLTGSDRDILKLKPGITGPATLKYRNEEELLASQPDPHRYNDEVIFPDKVRINLSYLSNRSFMGDLRIILDTLLPS